MMRIGGSLGRIVAPLALVLVASTALADSTDYLVFRQAGWFRGKGEVSSGQIKCEIPTVASAITDGTFSLGLWNTYGAQTLFFPDVNSAFGNPCGGWIQMHNFLFDQYLLVDHVDLKFRVQGARRFRAFVPTRNGLPSACTPLRKQTVYTGTLIPPANSVDRPVSVAGQDNVAFLQVLPIVDPQLLYCLRGAYAPLDPTLYQSFPLVVSAQAVGFSDAGDKYRSNTISYHLTLRHTCGNGRVDDGESCDPNSIGTTCTGVCTSNVCSNNPNLACATSADCTGTCVAAGDPVECNCIY